jgi:hypothetical protein
MEEESSPTSPSSKPFRKREKTDTDDFVDIADTVKDGVSALLSPSSDLRSFEFLARKELDTFLASKGIDLKIASCYEVHVGLLKKGAVLAGMII